jgi:hypothetical protein
MHPQTTRTPTSGRWGFLVGKHGKHEVAVDGKPLLKRRRLQCPLFGILFTRIYVPDSPQRAMHAHSRPFLTFIASGYYIESVERVLPGGGTTKSGAVRAHPRFSLRYLPADYAHRITAVSKRKPLLTVALVGRHLGTWHFYPPDGEPVDWKDYG